MENTTITESEIKSRLLTILKKEDIKDLSLKIVGNTEKGDGYSGDIVFVQAIGITEDNQTKNYDLVLKCSKKSEALRKSSPMKEAFYNEIFLYNTILPYFTQFQLEKGITNTFSSMPKCYGTFTDDNSEFIAFENLKKSGYDLWPRKDPVTRKHLNLVLGEYAQYHAISVALEDQRPGKLREFGDELADILKKFIESGNTESLYHNVIDEIADLLQEELEESVLLKWKDLKKQVLYVFHDLINNVDGVKVIVHGDCWNNNFMYKSENGNKNAPTRVSILDWQLARYSSPVLDLAYHIFSCISPEDLNDLPAILQNYYETFSEQVKLLGSKPEDLYPLKQFLADWKKYRNYGILMSTLITKMCSAEKDEVVDLAQHAEDGKDFSDFLRYEVEDKINFKRRMRPIVEYVGRDSLI